MATEGVDSSESGISRLLARHGGSRAKKTVVAAEQSRDDVAKARVEWREEMPGLAPAKLVRRGNDPPDRFPIHLTHRRKRV